MSEDDWEHGLSAVRQTLSRFVGTTQGPAILFEALSRLPPGQDVPTDRAELTQFISGPLKDVLETKLDAVALEDAMGALSRLTARPPSVRPSSIEIEVDFSDIEERVTGTPMMAGGLPSDMRTTLAIGTMAPEIALGEPVKVLVIAGTERLSRQILVSFGGHRVKVLSAKDLDACSRALDEFSPDLVIVDGQESANIGAIDLAAHLGGGSGKRLVVVWASDQPWGSAIAKALDGRVAVAEVPRRVGVDAMLDYIRARFS